ncbi:hypothetical protein [Defluviimonas sp. SAOS-178_SWC]|uniref:hypothetical protein n=1 Tax=Defluviimonas sp. SAOS-178_SWC TaxID=3121287 RepID=UPI0032220DB6
MTDASSKTVQVIDSALSRHPLPITVGEGCANAILWPGNGACYRTVNIIDLGGGGRTVDLSHAHECVYYIASGSGCVRDLVTNETQELVEGSMIHIGPRDAYRLEGGEIGMKAVGGCVPVDPDLYNLKPGGGAA